MKKPQLKINGILLLNKPLDLSSNTALQKVKRLFNAQKAGHTGSLDPKATGMLPICFGEATKFSQFLLESDKRYRVEGKLGIKTTTGDAEGEIIAQKEVGEITEDLIETILKDFQGEQQQIPPMYSAIKINGQPLYTLARKGIEIPRQARTVIIYSINLLSIKEDTITLDIHCSKGTYIRTLIEDIGDKLGVGAYVTMLHRTSVTPYETEKMYNLPELEAIFQTSGLSGLKRTLLPLETSVKSLPAVQLSSAAAFYLSKGQSISMQTTNKEGDVRLYSSNAEFIGVASIMADGRLTPLRLINPMATCPNRD